jgi:alkylhydroperoxidase family enzyme
MRRPPPGPTTSSLVVIIVGPLNQRSVANLQSRPVDVEPQAEGENKGTSRANVKRVVDGGPLAAHPALRRYVRCFLETFLVDGLLDPRLRELTILRIAWRCGQPFEWASHYRIARRLDISDADVLAARTGPHAPQFGPVEQALLTAADEVVELGQITEPTYARCRGVLGGSEVLALELLHLVAGYRMMATILATSRPSLVDAGLTLWPPDGVGPATGAPHDSHC